VTRCGCEVGTLREPLKGERPPLETGTRGLVSDSRRRGPSACYSDYTEECNYEILIPLHRL
jgi:hypothetical protein